MADVGKTVRADRYKIKLNTQMLQCGMIIAFKYDQNQKQEIRKGGDCHVGKKVY